MKLKPDPYLCTMLLLFSVSSVFFYCKDQRHENEQQKDSKQLAKDFNERKSIDDKESNFLISAADLSLREIEMAKLAQKNASGEDIKKLSKWIEEENSKFMEDLKKLATSKSITIPLVLTIAGSRDVDRLGRSAGADFDEKFCAAMVEEEKEAIKKYKSATEDIEDIDIRNWANKNLPLIRDNLDQAMTCQQTKRSNGQQNPENEVNTGKNKPREEVTAAQRVGGGSTGGNNSGSTTGGNPEKKSSKKEKKKEKEKESEDKK